METIASIGSAAIIVIFLFYTCMELIHGKGVMKSKFMQNKYVKAIVEFFFKE